ncbi:MAG: hypothetical protein JXM70_24440 [Pirellulales bacterium]|nr:hypothetical protein [Pirellulales bacterium]
MNWLIWREYRLNRLILIAGVVLLLLPYLIVLVALLWPKSPPLTVPHVTKAFLGAAIYSLVLSQLTITLLGGNAIAGERADRSAEFIAYLPLPRKKLLGAKLSLSFFAVSIIWVTNLLVLGIVACWIPQLRQDINEAYKIPYYIALTGFVFYGVSWLISSLQSSPTFAVAGGLLTPLSIVMGSTAVVWALDFNPTEQFVQNGYTAICLILALVCFSIGTWYYLKRVEP